MKHTFGIRDNGEEFLCTKCSTSISVGFGNIKGPFGTIVGEDECLCANCCREREVPEFILTTDFKNSVPNFNS